jgi:iron complex outermembrane recepter protein
MLASAHSSRLARAVRIALGTASLSMVALAAHGQAAAPASDTELEAVTVTGFRSSLDLALTDKRNSVAAVDSIRAEDIVDFPDLNLAESIQRIPGVALARDAGEGRSISVRGLSPEFTRVRLNGIEAMSANGGTDAAGGTNRGRGFDFNTFASDLFSSIVVHKSAQADLEEGSLGATVDLRTGRPFDLKGFNFVISGQGQYNDLADQVDPRASMLISNTWADGKFGALFSAAYTNRRLVDEGSSTVRWGTPSANGNFGGLAPGYSGTATLAQLNAAFVPRIPRYDYYKHEQDRLGLTGALQWAPNDRFSLNLDVAYAEFNAQRDEIFLEAPNFSAAANGMRVQNAVIDANNTLVYGVFNNVDIRSEHRHDELSTEFKQATLDGAFDITDKLRATALVGYSQAKHDNPIQTTLLFDWLGFPQLTYDYRDDSRLPQITYTGADVTSAFQGVRPPSGSPTTYASNGWYLSQVRLRPQTTENTFKSGHLQLDYTLNDTLTFRGGGEYKEFEFATTELRRSNGTNANQEATIPASVAAVPIGNYTETFTLAKGFSVPAGTTTTFVMPNIDNANALFDFYNTTKWPMGPQPALNNNRGVTEKDTSVFAQMDWNTTVFDRTLRGNIGVRYVETKQYSNGYTYASGAPVFVEADHKYDDTLPSLNLAYSITDDFLIRASAAKVMSRPGLAGINPGGTVSVSGSARTATLGNPTLDPTTANAYDLAFEWYFAKESLLSLALFYKDVGSRPTATTSSGPFTGNPFGIPDSVAIAACGATSGCSPSAEWTFNTTVNGDGGWLRGLEASYQQPFTFLTGAFSGFGTIMNFTYVDSEFKYPNGTAVIIEQLDGLSKISWNATLYYQRSRFEGRVSAAFRDQFLTRIPGQNGNSVEGTLDTLTLDASARFSVTPQFDLTFEALNLTDAYQDQYVDASNRPVFYHHTGRNFLLGARFKF